MHGCAYAKIYIYVHVCMHCFTDPYARVHLHRNVPVSLVHFHTNTYIYTNIRMGVVCSRRPGLLVYSCYVTQCLLVVFVEFSGENGLVCLVLTVELKSWELKRAYVHICTHTAYIYTNAYAKYAYKHMARHVCIHAYMYIIRYTCIDLPTHISLHACIHISHMCTDALAYLYVHVHAFASIYSRL